MVKTIYTISVIEALTEYERNSAFRNTVLSEKFVYANNKYVRNDTLYIEYTEDGKPAPTVYAEEHPEECFLTFDETVTYIVYKTSKRAKSGDKENVDTERDKTLSSTNEIWVRAAIREAKRVSRTEKTFWEYLREIIANNDSSTDDFESRTLLNTQTFYKYMDEKRRPKTIEVPTVVAIAVGYDLTLHETEGLMKSIGLSFVPSDRDHSIYKFILTLRGWSIHERNKVLDMAGVKRLGSQARK